MAEFMGVARTAAKAKALPRVQFGSWRHGR